MKLYFYTLRDHAGALKKGKLQAVDRADALRQIKAMNCVPLSVTDSSGVAARESLSWNPAWNRCARWLGIASVFVIATLAVWQTVAKRHAALLADTAQKNTSVAHSSQPGRHTAKSVQDAPYAATVAEKKAPPSSPATMPLPVTRPVTKKTASSETIPQPEAIEPPQPLQPPTPYKTQTESLLAMAMSVSPGAAIPPLPISTNLDADFANSLTNVIVIYDDDDERSANTKENVAVAKNQLRELVEKGRSVAEVLKEYQETTNLRAELRSEAQKKLINLYQNSTPEEAQAFMIKINTELKEQGIESISLPRTLKAP